MVVKIPLYLVSHHRKIASLYKKWLRNVQGYHPFRESFLYESALIRAEFNAIYYEKDMRISKKMLLDKEREFQKKILLPPITFPSSPEGVAYERYVLYEDWILDWWHPLEKAMYPDYFARRELRKQQYLEMWEKANGPPKPQNH